MAGKLQLFLHILKGGSSIAGARVYQKQDSFPMQRSLNILHLSDLHFGRIDQRVLETLERFMQEHKEQIDLTILTGDLTQRARHHEFLAAHGFLASLKSPLFLVPGNHDIPLFNLFQRFFSPYGKFLKYMHPFASNYYDDEKLAVIGLWTTDHLSIQQGIIRSRDFEHAFEKFSQVSPDKIKIIASHHPLLSISHSKSRQHLNELLQFKPHLLMWGHEHHAQVRPFSSQQHLPLLIASGTSVSNRTRLQKNSFNYLSLSNDSAKVEIHHFDPTLGKFQITEEFKTSLRKVSFD
jgi:3',5'-cyclic AMP phosphodiesterase CpdA